MVAEVCGETYSKKIDKMEQKKSHRHKTMLLLEIKYKQEHDILSNNHITN